VTIHLRAIYEHGNLRLLTPIDLEEGEEVEVIIASSQLDNEALLHEALDGYVRWNDPTDNRHEELEALAQEVAKAFSEGKPLSEIVIEDRGEQ
jgi:predicted DNA-binding antitoxin AbrB/MazE fold protein